MSTKTSIIFDMETSDPDDFMTLLLLLGHPRVDLKAVTVHPGSKQQVALVRKALSWFGRDDLHIGAYNINHPESCVSQWHYDAYGISPDLSLNQQELLSPKIGEGWEVLCEFADESTTILTGGPLGNLRRALKWQDRSSDTLGLPPHPVARRIVCQGGFAGDNIVPKEKRLPKFDGKITCPTFNLNGDPAGALAVLQHPGFSERRFVSKNVCHGVIYDPDMHSRFAAVKEFSQSVLLIWKGMEYYLSKKRDGKAFHDPLAACCAIDDTIGEWAEVMLYREKGEWGAKPCPGSGTWIIVGYDREKFIQTMLEH